MPQIETNTRKIIARLKAEGWELESGAKHDKLVHANRRGDVIILPRHRTISPGVGRKIAKTAGWARGVSE